MPHSGGGQPAASSRDFLSGGGEMGALMRTMDWSKTRLGPIDQWPQSLRTSVSTCLNSRFAILVWWGPELIMLYNDAYREIIASKHPDALGNPGRDCWPEIWDTIGPMLDGVMQRSEATWSDDLLLLLARHGYPEECYFTFSYSPISDESGGIGGIFTPVMETTERVIAERRSKTLRDLAATSAEANSEDKMWAAAAAILGSNAHDFSFSVLYTLTPDQRFLHPRSWSGVQPNDVLCRGPKDVSQLDSPLFQAVARALRTGEITLVSDLELHCPDLPVGFWGLPAVEAAAVPLPFPGTAFSACLLAGLNPRKRFDSDYRSFLETIARQLTTNVVAARAHEEEAKRVQMLADLDRAKTLFFSNVSHELRTPLTLIVGPVEDMLERASPSADVQQSELQLVHRNSMRLLKLVNTLLDFSRIEAGRVQAAYEATDLSALTADIASSFRSAMQQAGLEFVIDCPPLPEPVYIDREMWEKIVLNLVSNAFKFTLQGSIAVRVRNSPAHIELSVEDTGLGIPEEQQSKVFERFHRVEGIRGRTHEGSGIGLALVLELAKLHGGSIRLESALGKGSKFVVSIPKGSAHLAAENLSSQPTLKSTGVSASAYVDEALSWLPETGSQVNSHSFAADSVQAPHVANSTGRILLADDNADMRGYVRRLLGEAYEIESVSNGREALAAIRSNPPDLVLTDVMMPELDGFGLLHELRANKSTSTIPVILLSAKAGEDARIEGLQAGADDYIVKPFTARELLARVGAHLALGRMRRDAAERERTLRTELEIRVQERTAELQLANEELRELSSRLQKMRDDERRRIARELHDSAGQLLTALSMNISIVQTETHKLSPDAVKRVQENASLIEQLSTEIRTMSHLLHPPLLDEIGLSSALEWYVEGFATRSGIAATIDIPGDLERLPADMEIAIFRAVQESLTNVHRHSGSRSCWVKVTEDKNHFRVEIKDSGKGIPKEKRLSLTSTSGGVGLRGMQERIRQLGGTLEIESSDVGTTVMVTLPRPKGPAKQIEGAA